MGVLSESVNKLIERVAARENLELVHWDLLGPSGKQILRIYIDKPGGVSLDDCEKVSNEVGVLLDMEDLIPSSYTLEVSSPGVERGLYKLADYERFAGNRVRVKTAEPIDGQRNFHGKLEGVSNNKVILQEDRVGHIEIAYEKIVKANIEYNFNS
ncbi:MAG TPA: ribosome maturation factor RimP [Blastocatellia bacterium]|nr:ribosome maturation factor RimP [Blastocatellia bacterium]